MQDRCQYIVISCLLIKVKQVLKSQGRVIGNWLHLVFGCEVMGYQLERLMGYLEGKRSREKGRYGGQIGRKFQIKSIGVLVFVGLIGKEGLEGDGQLFGEMEFDNILSIPLNYLTRVGIEKQSLPIHYSISEVTKKPPEYSYITQNGRINCGVNERDLGREMVYAENEMKMQWAKLQKIKIVDGKEGKKGVEKKGGSQEREKISFQLFKYL